jgi:hypothetical protein
VFVDENENKGGKIFHVSLAFNTHAKFKTPEGGSRGT